MNRLFVVALFLLSGWQSFAETDAKPEVKKESFLDLLSKSPSEMKQLQNSAEKDFKKAMAKLSPKERKIVMRIHNLVRKETEKPSASGLPSLIQLRSDVREWQKVGSKTPEYQLNIVEGAISFSYALPETNAYNERRAMASELLVTVSDILAKDPSNNHALTLQPRLLSNAGADELQVIESYRQCVLADKTNSSCQAGYDNGVESYETIRCPEGRVKETLRFFAADEQKHGPYSEKIMSGDQTYYTLDQPVTDGRDIQEARLSITNDEPVIFVEFNSQGASRFEKATASNVGKYIAIVLNGKAISVPRVTSAIGGGKVQISVGTAGQPKDRFNEANRLLNTMCSAPQSKKLPDALRIQK